MMMNKWSDIGELSPEDLELIEIANAVNEKLDPYYMLSVVKVGNEEMVNQ